MVEYLQCILENATRAITSDVDRLISSHVLPPGQYAAVGISNRGRHPRSPPALTASPKKVTDPSAAPR